MTAAMPPGARLVDRLGLVGLDLEELAQLQPFAQARDLDRFVLLDRAGIDADEVDILHEGVDAGIEDLGDQWPGGVGLDLDRFAGGVLASAR